MESFDIGNHVLIELDDTRRIAGHLVNVTETGFVLKVTHKDLPTVHAVSVGLKAGIREELGAVPYAGLVAECVSRGLWTGLGRRGRMIEALALVRENEIVERNQEAHPVKFHELSVPVLTFINGGMVAIMEDSDDVLEDMEFESQVEEFKAGVDDGIAEILGVAESAPE